MIAYERYSSATFRAATFLQVRILLLQKKRDVSQSEVVKSVGVNTGIQEEPAAFIPILML